MEKNTRKFRPSRRHLLWQGYIYHVEDKDPRQFPRDGYNVNFESPLFKFEGFNIARFAEDGAGGYRMAK